MRHKVTLSLDEDWVAEIDRQRGLVPRSRYVEMISGIPSSSLTVRRPAKDERSPDPQREARAVAERQLGKSPEESIAAVQRAQSVKPPLPRPIIQKRGT
jgi:hypothetical protein